MTDISRKPEISEFEDCLEIGVILLLTDGKVVAVNNYNKSRHLITLSDERKVDLYTFYPKIDTVWFLRDAKGNPTGFAYFKYVYNAILRITNACKYHVYISVIKAYLEGDEEHYIYPWCNNLPCFGCLSYISENTIQMMVDGLVHENYLKEKLNKRGIPYYFIRKNGKPWPKRTKINI